MWERSRIPPSPPPCLVVGAVSCFALPSSPLALTRSLPPHAPRHHIPPISAHVIIVPPLTDNVKYIDSGPRFSFPQQVHPVPLDVLPSPLSSCLQKQEIVQNDPANRSTSCCQRWCCCHPKARSVCQPDGSLISRGPVADAIFLRGETGYRLHMAVMANSIFLRG